MFLLDFIKTLIPVLNKSDVLEDVRVTKAELESTVIPSINQASENIKIIKLKAPKNKELVNVFFRNYSLSNSSKNILAEIALKLPVVLQNLVEVEKTFDEDTGKDIITDGVTNKKAIMLRAIEQISFLSRFTMDLLVVLYNNEALDSGIDMEESIEVPKIVNDRVTRNMGLYAILLSIYGDSKFTFDKRIANMPDVVLNETTSASVLSVYGAKNLDPINSPLVMGFDYNPIYHIRLLVAEWQASRYQSMKDKKKMLELRLLHLKLLEDKKSDPKIEKEISYIQSRVDSIEYSMTKMEKDVE